jgi:hypothetical protein
MSDLSPVCIFVDFHAGILSSIPGVLQAQKNCTSPEGPESHENQDCAKFLRLSFPGFSGNNSW